MKKLGNVIRKFQNFQLVICIVSRQKTGSDVFEIFNREYHVSRRILKLTKFLRGTFQNFQSHVSQGSKNFKLIKFLKTTFQNFQSHASQKLKILKLIIFLRTTFQNFQSLTRARRIQKFSSQSFEDCISKFSKPRISSFTKTRKIQKFPKILKTQSPTTKIIFQNFQNYESRV